MRFDVYVTGQYSENYGAHDWDGKGACPQYWKMKGSHEQLVFPNVGLETLEEARNAALAKCGELSYSDDFSAARFDDVLLLPAGAKTDVKFAIQYSLSVADLRRDSFLPADELEEQIQLYIDWRRYYNEEHILGL